ncbi:P-loop containing nucleoside triphosphate hydrolase protein [Phlegmacium glaucopus]|nr:P-loop containing nucleoside triphosphate hydrolase protein [Phlegmacium glaucopus]
MSAKPAYCIPFVTTGCVFGRNCSLRHDIYKCECGTILRKIDQELHCRGKKHQLLLLTSAGHDDKVQDRREPRINGRNKTQSNPTQEGPRKRKINNGVRHVQLNETHDNWTHGHSERPLTVCKICHRKICHSDYDAHVEEHMRRQHFATIRTTLEDAKKDKEGVKVTGRSGIDFGVLDVSHSVEVAVSITSTESAVYLQRCQMRSSSTGSEHEVKFSARLRGKSRVVHQDSSRVLSIIFYPSYAGVHEDTLELAFYDPIRQRSFVITRSVIATVGSKDDYDQLKVKVPYTRKKISQFTGTIIPSLRSPARIKTVWAEKISTFSPPQSLIEATYGPHVNPTLASQNVKKWMPGTLNAQSYPWWFQVLLFLEEHMKLNLCAYSLSGVELEKTHLHYNLLVEGLAENRPSVLVGDIILVSHSDSLETFDARNWYEGRVIEVHQKHVSLRFRDGFDPYKGTKFDVQFTLNRLPFRRMHHVLVNNNKPARLLFPEPSHIEGATRPTREMMDSIIPYYRPLAHDKEQLETVAAIINQKPGSVPFVVFGPPGTGKTITLVEAMQQILDRDPNARILACAPNNAAADLIAQKLVHRGASKVFRLNAVSRRLDDLPHCLLDISLVDDNQVFDVPKLAQLMSYRVVVATCLSAGIPANLGVKRGYYSHIFIDEAGQAKEPEIMVPIKGIADENTNVIIAGDNQQLGPVVHSYLAKSLGLQTSYLDRMMSRSIYDLNTNRGITIVKLVKNFRSHRDILQFSNDTFYESELQPCADRILVHSLDAYEGLPTKGFPLIFHGVVGRDEQEASSPSFFNIDEATLVKNYCLDLVHNSKNATRAEHIGVITPYHAQRCKITELFSKNHKLRDIKVGSVEEFQGQERRVIIISTVRSNRDFITADIKRSLGFVANKSRLNVALTRAQALLIVIGNPVVLSLDPLWRSFLNFVHTRGGWKGKEIDWNPEETILHEATDGYGEERRASEEGDLEAAIVKLKALIMEIHEGDGFGYVEDELEEDVVFERPILREAE